jgi:hypothetical protein
MRGQMNPDEPVGFPRELMVKQFVGKVRGNYCDFLVFTTGDPKYLLFCPLDRYGCQGTLQFPIKKTDLCRDWKKRMIV